MAGGEIVPAKLGNKAIPDFDVVLVETMAVGVAPFEDFAVRSTLQHALAQFVVFDPEKFNQAPIRSAAQVLMILGIELLGGMKPNLIEQAGEIAQAIRLIQRAPWFHARNLKRVGASRKRSPRNGPLPERVFR